VRTGRFFPHEQRLTALLELMIDESGFKKMLDALIYQRLPSLLAGLH
jgi:hypothetical protein